MLRKYIPKEKIEIFDQEEEKAATESKTDMTESPFKLLEDCGINTAKGLASCGGDDEFYRSILLEYVKGAEEKKEDLKKFIDANDLGNYGILIHSLKSTSAMIGAEAPYRIALELELAAKEGNGSYVMDNHSKFLDEYNKILGVIENVVSSEDEIDEYDIDENGVMEFSPDPD